MTKVKVDFNSRGPRGWVRGSERRADGPLSLDDIVTLFDPDEHMEYEARVAEKDPESGRVFFEVFWHPAPVHGVSIGAGDQVPATP